MAAGPYITTHQGLTDWYPTWIGAPETSIGKLVTNSDEAVEEIRRQVKNGVDCIKIALDGIQRRPDGELDRRLHPGRDRHHGAREPPPRQKGDGPCASAARRRFMRRAPGST